ncbi:hypothetical protein [Bacillus manliponensis]|nr:hypothetical protein [Bacillus manliponensis]
MEEKDFLAFIPLFADCKTPTSKLERKRRSLGGGLAIRKSPICLTNAQWG